MSFNPTTDYLDIYNVALYQFFGNPVLMYFILFVLLVYGCAKYAVPFQPSILLMVLFTMVYLTLSAVNVVMSVYTLILFGAGLAIYYFFAKRFGG